jgi:uncharacterized protein (TIGR01370 family)
MEHNKMKKFLSKIISPFSSAFKQKSAFVYYGENLDFTRIPLIDYVIVEPKNIDTRAQGFEEVKENIYAYVSVCEVSKDDKNYHMVKEDWIVGKNPMWNSDIIDIRNEEYKKFLFKEVIDPIFDAGFKNIFFDTLDSYQKICKTLHKRINIESEVANFINTVHEKYPDAKIVVNRGFEIIDTIYSSIDAVLFESYHFGLGTGVQTYKAVSEADKLWLDSKLAKIKSYGLPIISVDYLPENELDAHADEAIEAIRDNNMIPYVGNKELNIYGRSICKVPKKR